MFITGVVAAGVLADLWWYRKDYRSEPQIALLEFNENLSKEVVKMPALDVNGSIMTNKFKSLTTFITNNPPQVERYRMFRRLTSKHPAKDLIGLHCALWKDFTISIFHKEQNFDLLKDVPDPAGDIKSRRRFASAHIIPAGDTEFLREANSLMPGKLFLAVLVIREEMRLGSVSMEDELISMCHLYNALQQLGFLELKWRALDDFINLHMIDVFRGALPTTNARIMVNRALLCYGISPTTMEQTKTSERQALLNFHPLMHIVAANVNDGHSPRQTLNHIDKYMVGQARKAGLTVKGRNNRPIKSYTDELGTIAYLKEMETHMHTVDPYFECDSTELSRIANDLFEKMDCEQLQDEYSDMKLRKAKSLDLTL